MSPRIEKLLKDALELSDKERADLAGRLIDSLEHQFDDDSAAAWDAELERRINELDSGAVASIPWSDVRRRLMGRLDDASAA